MIYLVCVGNLKEKYLELACSEYSKRISRYSQIKIIECKESIVNNINVALKTLLSHAKVMLLNLLSMVNN